MKKNFTSITMFEIYRRAWNDLMADWSREYERKEHAKQLGKPHELSDRRLAKYDEQMLEISEAMNELEREMKTGEQEVTYSDIVHFLEENKYIDTRFSLVSFLVGYYGQLTPTMWGYICKAYTDGFINA